MNTWIKLLALLTNIIGQMVLIFIVFLAFFLSCWLMWFVIDSMVAPNEFKWGVLGLMGLGVAYAWSEYYLDKYKN